MRLKNQLLIENGLIYNMNLKDQNVLITGAAEGLGLAISNAFDNESANLFLIDKNIKKLNSNGFKNSKNYCVDLSNISELNNFVSLLYEKNIEINTLIHNASILTPTSFDKTSEEHWDQVSNITLKTAFILSKFVWKKMKMKKNGVIIFVSSRSGIVGFKDESAYCAAKHGLEGLMKSLSLEGSDHGIQAFSITPGMFMNTPMSHQNYTEEYKKKWVNPLLLTPAFLKLASRKYGYLTGQHLNAWKLSN